MTKFEAFFKKKPHARAFLSLFKAPLTNAQLTAIACPLISLPFIEVRASLASLNASYSIKAYPYCKEYN
jgi:hypothetical protein